MAKRASPCPGGWCPRNLYVNETSSYACRCLKRWLYNLRFWFSNSANPSASIQEERICRLVIIFITVQISQERGTNKRHRLFFFLQFHDLRVKAMVTLILGDILYIWAIMCSNIKTITLPYCKFSGSNFSFLMCKTKTHKSTYSFSALKIHYFYM